MVRDSRAVIVAAAVFLWAGMTFGQEEFPRGARASHGEHAADEHGMHGEQEAAGMDLDAEVQGSRSQSFLVWFVSSLGWRYAILLPVSALFSFVLTAVLVLAGKGKTTGAAVGFVVAIPLLVGLVGLFDGLMSSFTVI